MLFRSVVVLDINMPGLNGWQMLEAIKLGHPQARIIAMSGKMTEEISQTILERGVSATLAKPFTGGDLRAAWEWVVQQEAGEVGH